jgi:predicted CXXCH cytochrome family protein
MRQFALAMWFVFSTAGAVIAQPSSIVGSPHDLSAGGPGPVRAAFEDQVCIFCHTPHNASPIRPLWNRYMPVDNYRIYNSRALDAQPGQPTGASKMCLSCHDGTIALGVVYSRDTPIILAGGITVMPVGQSNLGTDLSDDHPISFRYDSALAAQDAHLRDPSLLPPELELDFNRELQCTTCHDAHDDSRGNFLVMHNTDSQLCNACHQIGNTSITDHQNCNACHQPHSAPSGPYLLRGATVSETCLTCHDGNTQGAPNIAQDLNKPYIHETYSPVDPLDPQYMHTSCTSCHDPHTMNQGSAPAPLVHPNFGDIDGVNASGSLVAKASFEYEVCFKCHADQQAVPPTVSRLIPDNNARTQFSPGAISYHPVEAAGKNPDVPSLRAGWSTSSYVSCSDCHSSNSGTDGGGTGPNGVHGSNFSPLFVARYETADYTSESAQAYALCYMCHDRNSILGDDSFDKHKKHIQGEDAPCSACHTGHGIASGQGTTNGNSHLINFDTSIVFPDPDTGRLEFRDTGRFRGECYLTCHGEDHSPEDYND